MKPTTKFYILIVSTVIFLLGGLVCLGLSIMGNREMLPLGMALILVGNCISFYLNHKKRKESQNKTI